jgi:hypothetical protein
MKTNYLFLLCITLIFACKEEKKTEPIPIPEAEVETVTSSTFLSLSDVHLDSTIENTEFGYNNDTGKALWACTKTKIEKVVGKEKPKFMVYLGDLPHHEDSMRKTNVQLMLENLGDLAIDIPILYLPGNNDALGGDYHSFTDTSGDTPFSTDTIASWPVLNRTSSSTTVTNIDLQHKKFGFYSAKVNTGNSKFLKIIALNTVIFTNNESSYNSHTNEMNKMVGDDGKSQQQAAQIQMRWLEQTLDSLKSTERVMLIMHIPPGKDGYGGGNMWNPKLNYTTIAGNSLKLQNAFLDLVEVKQSNITGILTGHTHLDGIRRLYKSHHNPKSADMIGVSVSTPGITIGHGNNPAFKTFTYNEANYNLLDFKTHFAVPTEISKNAIAKAKVTSQKEGRKVAPKPDSLFVFRGDSSYTFKESYKATSTTDSTIYSTIYNMDKSTIINYMNSIYGAKSNQDVLIKHESALDVHKEN